MDIRPEVGYPAYRFTFSAVAETAFTQADCAQLALELTARTGFIPITASIDDPYNWYHAAVLTPAGDVLDINGVTMPDEWLDRWLDGMSGEEHFLHEWDDEDFSEMARGIIAKFPDYPASTWALKVVNAYDEYLDLTGR